MRLIDADAFINRIVFHTDFETDVKELFEDEISAEPTIESQHKKGKWIDGSIPTYFVCSVCAYQERYADENNFCPNCGADMTEGEG